MKQVIALSLISFCLWACNTNKPANMLVVSQCVQIDDAPAECPYLTKDHNGHAVLSWVRMVNDSTTAFCYATSADGKSFSAPVIVPNTSNIQPHGENLPKIIFKPSGEIIALWGTKSNSSKNKYAGLVAYTQSFDNGKTWTGIKPLVIDTAGHDQRYYDVALLPNGEAAIIWLDNRKNTSMEGSALYFASTNGKNGFGPGKLISESCCQCCRTDLFVDQQGGIHTLFRGIVQDSIRDMVHMVSTDGGANFSSPKRISEDNWVINGCPHTGPAMTENASGIHFAWFTGGRNKGCYYTRSADNGQSFAKRDSVSLMGSHPQLASLPGNELMIVWDESQVVNDKVSRRIGIQQRGPEGESGQRQYLTGADGKASYPVITTLGNRSSLVAYSTVKDNKNYVAWQLVSIP
jgi:hypothetical protein